MKFTVEVTKADTIYQKKSNEDEPDVIQYYDIAFTIVHENGMTFYVPDTIYPNQLQLTTNTLASAVELAGHRMIPAQIARMYGKYARLQDSVHV